jgi:hypothetical protein
MKKVFLLPMLLMCIILHAQVSSNCNVPPLLAEEYDRDVKQLATYRLFEIQSPDTVLVTIPQEDIDSISQGLAAIFNATFDS